MKNKKINLIEKNNEKEKTLNEENFQEKLLDANNDTKHIKTPFVFHDYIPLGSDITNPLNIQSHNTTNDEQKDKKQNSFLNKFTNGEKFQENLSLSDRSNISNTGNDNKSNETLIIFCVHNNIHNPFDVKEQNTTNKTYKKYIIKKKRKKLCF